MARSYTKQSASPLDASFTGGERIVVLHGKESFLHVEHMRRLREAIEQQTGGEVETVRFDGRTAGLADVLDELRSVGLIQQHKLIVVTEADAFLKQHRAAVERYAAAPVDTATLLLRADTWNKGNLDKAILKVGQIIKCERPKPAEAQAWFTRRAVDTYGVKIEPRAAALLLEHLGADLGLLDSELSKLAVGAPASGISAEQVQALAGHASDQAAFKIQEALMTGRARTALETLHELTDLAGHDPVPIIWAVCDLMRKLHHAATLSNAGLNEFKVCSELKVWPREQQRPFMNLARRLRPAGAARLLARAMVLNRRARSGFGNPLRGLEVFCVELEAALR